MPATYNIGTQVTGIDPRVVSVRYWLWPSVDDRTTELPNTQAGFQQCHYLEFEGYDRRNAQGNVVFALNHIDTGPQSVFDAYAVGVSTQTAIEDLLRAAFPPALPD